VKLYDTDTLIIVHVEPQSYVQRDFNFRMYQYFNLLHNKYRLPIIPIAIFSYEEAWNEDTYISETKGFGLTGFRYATLHLRSKDWRKFLKQDNPVAGALLSKMDYSEEERV